MAGKKKATDLTAKQQRFVEEYLVDCNGKQAAIRAGYSAKTAENQASRLLSNAKVADAIEVRQKKLSDLADVSSTDVVRQLARMAFVDARKLFDDAGRPIGIQSLDDNTASAVQGFSVVTVGNQQVGYGEVLNVRLADRNQAADKLMKHLGGYEKDNSQRNLAAASTEEIQAALSQKLSVLRAQGVDVSKLLGQ